MKEAWSILLDLDPEFCEFKDGRKCWFDVVPMEVGLPMCTLHPGQPILRSNRMRVQRPWGHEEVFRDERLDICKGCRVRIVGEKP